MKKLKRIQLNIEKEVISNLNSDNMRSLAGGAKSTLVTRGEVCCPLVPSVDICVATNDTNCDSAFKCVITVGCPDTKFCLIEYTEQENCKPLVPNPSF